MPATGSGGPRCTPGSPFPSITTQTAESPLGNTFSPHALSRVPPLYGDIRRTAVHSAWLEQPVDNLKVLWTERARLHPSKWAVSAVFSSGHVRALSEEDVEGGVYHQIEQTATETIYLGQPKPLLF